MADLLNTSIPLRSFNQVTTSDLSILEAAVNRYYTGTTIELARGVRRLNVVANRCDLNTIGITYGRHEARLRLKIPALQTYALLLPYNGSAAAESRGANIEVLGHFAFVGSTAEPVNLDYATDFEQLVFTVNADAAANKFEALTGERPPGRLLFDHSCDFRRPEAEALRRMIMLLLQRVDTQGLSFQPLALAEFEQAIIVTFLNALHHNLSHLLHRPGRAAASWQVRRAEEYIEANWDQPLTVEALALVTGVSTRSLFLSFQKSRGYSPMDFVKRVRLIHAKALLDRPGEATSVTDVAFACGFGNLGHFANYYRRRLGETPSETLRRSRRASQIWES
jgi:AraC-like DNA-binding protein